ncbi:enoyl-CoA hydratase/isomerase family protein [Amycolatopsis magusensis]|uniref:enoyl-CoA hydratase/isomerase family protein n=1 Tax=Amycolatopsis magusensis TaxID=882444 RepID=UPI0024A9892B|nr:enoyl-CoA hydratase/isomerase family protein [Amycolatopsis magusensis]MDI5978864.1 enoyl-CoA hydratase/isomerase family protein [Amycolatopsis magusensis]
MDLVHLSIERSVAFVTLNRPRVLNAVNPEMLAQFSQTLLGCAESADVDAVVIAGAGSSFCSGIDLTALANGEISRQWFAEWENAVALCEEMPKPVICAIHGYCLGGGLQIALACDIRLASADALFELPAIREGLIPGFGVYRLSRHLGAVTARRMVLFGERWPAAKALGQGLVDEVTGDRAALQALASRRAAELKFLAAVPSFGLCKKMLGLRWRDPAGELLPGYLDGQDECLRSAHHRRASATWLARSGAVVSGGRG